jgi:hypothetical protein
MSSSDRSGNRSLIAASSARAEAVRCVPLRAFNDGLPSSSMIKSALSG